MSSKIIFQYFILTSNFYQSSFPLHKFLKCHISMLQIEKKQFSVLFLLMTFHMTSIISLWKFTNFLSHLCERIILGTPIAFSKLNIIIIKIKCSQIQSIVHIRFLADFLARSAFRYFIPVAVIPVAFIL